MYVGALNMISKNVVKYIWVSYKYTTYLNTHIFSLFIIQMRFLMQFQFEGKTKFSATDFALMHQF